MSSVDMMARAADEWPWLLSPMTLAAKDLGAEYLMTPHVRLINQTCMDLVYGENDRVILNSPFRSSKSVTGTIYFAAWFLLWNPEKEVKVLTYGQELADEFGFKTREILREHGPSVGLMLRRDTSAKKHWRIEGHRGDYEALGRGGSLMGKGFHCGICDDLTANPEEAMSQVQQESTWHWFTGNFLSRVGPGGKMLLNMIRWGKRDVTGRVMELGKASGQAWKRVAIPAEAEPGDILGRQPGEQLWPLGSAMHEKMRRQMNDAKVTRWWAPCWQQRPSDEEGAYFKPRLPDGSWRWPLYQDIGDSWSINDPRGRIVVAKRDVTILVAVDWALSEKNTADYTAVTVGGVLPDGRLLMLDCVNERWRPETFAGKLGEICRRWRPVTVGVEKAQFQSSLARELRAQPGVPEVRFLETGNQANAKLRRALPAITMAENSRVLLPGWRPAWLDFFADQLASFNGVDDEHDDVPDSFAHLCLMAGGLAARGKSELPDSNPWTSGYRDIFMADA